MIRSRRRLFTTIVLAFFLMPITTTIAATPSPLAELKAPINEAIGILNDPVYKKTDEALKEKQRDKIWQSIEGMFDFEEVSKRALARDWRKFSATERKEFTDVFGKFLGNTYIDKIQGEYHNEKIVYGDEQILEGKWAMVRTKIKRETVEIPVDYKMMLKNGHWHVYDVIVEGISLVKNYRTQFRSILKKETPAQLIERLKKKQVESE